MRAGAIEARPVESARHAPAPSMIFCKGGRFRSETQGPARIFACAAERGLNRPQHPARFYKEPAKRQSDCGYPLNLVDPKFERPRFGHRADLNSRHAVRD